VGSGRSGACPSCGTPLERAQRYCVQCGARVAPRSSLLLVLLRHRASLRAPAASAAAGAAPAAGPLAAGAASRRVRAAPGAWFERALGGLTLPAPWISALLVLTFLGFGVLVGDVAGTRPYALSASRRPLKLIVPAAPASSSSRSTPQGSEAEPPPASSEATPEASESSSAESSGAESQSGSSSSSGSSPSSSGSSTGKERESSSGKSGSGSSGGPSSSKLPAIRHVFVIMLAEQPFASTFGPSSTAPYLARTLEHRGELLVRYYGVAHGPLANGIALLSGQGPTVATAAGCPAFADVAPGSAGTLEQVSGEGCVYPAATKTLMAQLAHKHLTARAYVQGIDEPGSASTACAHPPLGAADPSSQPASASPYATARNPFVYFHSVIDSRACSGEDVGLAALAHDLASEARTPAFSYIVPDRCDDGSPSPCNVGAPAGMPPADAMLKRVVPEILASPAYRKNGLLVVTVDGAPTSGELADTSSCCGQPRFPNLPPLTGKAALLGPEGGGQVGALLLSRYVRAGSVSQEPYNHFALLRTIENLFGLAHLGYAALTKVSAFEPSMFPVG